MFGIVVLVGAVLVYVAGRSDDGADDVAAVDAASAEESTTDEAAHDEAGEAPHETEGAEHDDELADEPIGTPAGGHDAGAEALECSGREFRQRLVEVERDEEDLASDASARLDRDQVFAMAKVAGIFV